MTRKEKDTDDDAWPRPMRDAGRAAGERWDDDGGPPGAPPAADDGEVDVDAYATRPAWSVLSLADLNEAVRRARAADGPDRLRRAAQRAERGRAARRGRWAEAARAAADRHRNAWENT